MTYSGEEGTAMGVNALADAKIAAAARNSFAMVALSSVGSYGGYGRGRPAVATTPLLAAPSSYCFNADVLTAA